MLRSLLVILALAASAGWPASLDLSGTVTSGDKPVADAVVWLDIENARHPARLSKAVLDQRNLNFAPRVVAVQVGTAITFPNNDRVFHNVFSFHDGKKFDLGLYPVGAVQNVVFDKPGLSRIFCNIHPQMAAYVMAVESPYFAVTDKGGRFTIPDVPAGLYYYRAWRPGAAVLKGLVVVEPGISLLVRWP
jgi:plastocyanin